ncbi:MAG: hypothetical protein CML01_16450 [Pseudomonas sp.]|nr:hypothetical protein [Pseudomonas sp.]|tara:strand:+ start:27078 stop:29003 length:1926 start_codon:yes stop_codon:yes gene_type:complete
MTQHQSDPLSLLLERLKGVKKNGERYAALCPAHRDNSPSLSLSRGRDGRALVHCYAGCETRDVLAAVGFELRDMFFDNLSLEQRQQYRRNRLETELKFERLIIEAAKSKPEELNDEDISRLALAQERIGQLDRELDEIETLTADPDEDKLADSKQSQASQLVAYVKARVELFHDRNKEVFARDLSTGEVRRIDSRQFRDWLVASYYKDAGKSARDQSVRESLSTLAGLGRYDCECQPVHIRVAGSAGRYFLDLAEPGQSRAICIEPGRWSIVKSPAAMFIRPEAMQPLPTPTPGGSIEPLWRIANIPEEQRLLVLAWLIECLRPDTPFPLVELMGEQGTAKSTAHTALRRLLDPNACDLRSAPKSAEEVFIGAGASWIVCYENVSHLSPLVQDALCTIATGGGYAKRKLFTDSDESIINVKRPVGINGISASVTAQDLIDRTISIEMPIVKERVEVTGLWQAYEAERGPLLGALLDTAVKALALLPSMRLPPGDKPRLVEFALLGMAVAEAVGKPAAAFMAQFNASRQESIARTIDASPVAGAILEWYECNPRGKRASAKMLMEEMVKYRPPYCDTWPKSPKGFADAMRRAAPALRQLGIECRSLGKIGGAVTWQIAPKEQDLKQCLESPDVLAVNRFAGH